MNKKLIVGSACVAAVLAVAGCAWGLGWFGTDEPDLDEFKTMLAEGPPTKERGEAMRQAIDKQTEGMTEDQKGEFFREKMMPLFVSMMAKRFSDEYDKMMAMSVEERNRELDRRIDEMQNWRRSPNRPGGGRPPGPAPTPAQMNGFRAKMLDLISPDQRSKMENGMKLMQQRMKERGMTPPSGPGGGFF